METKNDIDEKNKQDMLLRLKANSIEYYSINQQLKPFLTRKDFLKSENMMFMKLLGIEKAEFNEYRIEMIYPENKIGVDEELLVRLIGREEVEKLKEVPVDKLIKKVEHDEIGARAMEAVITEDGNPYIKVFKLNSLKR